MRGGCLPRGTERVVERVEWRSILSLLGSESGCLEDHFGILVSSESNWRRLCLVSRDFQGLERVEGFVLLFPDAR